MDKTARINHDDYTWDASRQVLTQYQHNISGVESFGHNISNRAVSPLDLHIHPNCLEITVMIKGKQTYNVGGESYPISGSHAFVSFPDEEHSSGNEPQSISEFYWIQINLSECDSFLNLERESGASLQKKLGEISNRTFRCDDKLIRLISNSFWEVSSGDPLRREYGVSLLTSFLYGVVLCENSDNSELSEKISNAVSFIHQNVCEDISLEAVADSVGLSISRFKTRFKNEVGVTPREYINRVKIEKAKEMLKDNVTVTRIAVELGFSSSNYFSVTFKKITAHSPSEYRQLFLLKTSD